MRIPPSYTARIRGMLQFHLRTLFALVTLVCVCFAWLGREIQLAQKEREAVSTILSLGGQVQYARQGWGDPAPIPTQPLWVRRLLGDEFFQPVTAAHVPFDIPENSADDLVAIRDLRHLEVLHLPGVPLTDDGVSHLLGLTHLKRLDVGAPLIAVNGLRKLAQLTQLEWLGLTGANLSDGDLLHLRDMPQLKHLDLGSRNLGDFGPLDSDYKMCDHGCGFRLNSDFTRSALVYLQPLTRLESLNISGMRSRKTADGDELRFLVGFTYLTSLDASYTEATDEELRHLTGLKNLRQLDLCDNPISDSGLKTLSAIRSLKDLDLSKTTVTDAGLLHLCNMPNLEWLHLSGNSITDAGLEHLSKLTQLRGLGLNSTRMTKAGLARLQLALPKTHIHL